MLLEQIIGLYLSPTTLSVLVNIMICMLISSIIHAYPHSKMSILFALFYEKVYDFFRDILGKEEKIWVITYVISLFFIILIANLQGVLIEFFAPIIGMNSEGRFMIEDYILSVSSDINFNIAMSVVSIVLIVGVQFSSLGIKNFFGSYFPVFGKGYLTAERGEGNYRLYIARAIPVKIFDIMISVFLGLLDLVGLLAKIISLSFRLFGNMTSGTVLLAMTVVMMSSVTNDWFGFSFPVGIPVIIYLQEMLIGAIQALVFSLLVSIFIKVARVD